MACTRTKCKECGTPKKSCQLVNGVCSKCRSKPVTPEQTASAPTSQTITIPKEEVFKVISAEQVIKQINANYYS